MRACVCHSTEHESHYRYITINYVMLHSLIYIPFTNMNNLIYEAVNTCIVVHSVYEMYTCV